VELRTALGPDIAARAAERGGPAIAPSLREILTAFDALEEGDAVGRQRRSMELWRMLVGASDNLAYQLAFNTMEQAWSGIQDLIAPALIDELGDRKGYEALVRAVESGDPVRARRAAQRLVDSGERGLLRVLGAAQGAGLQLPETSSPRSRRERGAKR
ncbi:MAG: FCD domain-containing protein, partial [Myxococcota bacterium]|nr:FCD domain-containing protein [Myxococcota bacterium]